MLEILKVITGSRAHVDGLKVKELMKKYGVSKSVVVSVRNYRSWTHVE